LEYEQELLACCIFAKFAAETNFVSGSAFKPLFLKQGTFHFIYHITHFIALVFISSIIEKVVKSLGKQATTTTMEKNWKSMFIFNEDSYVPIDSSLVDTEYTKLIMSIDPNKRIDVKLSEMHLLEQLSLLSTSLSMVRSRMLEKDAGLRPFIQRQMSENVSNV